MKRKKNKYVDPFLCHGFDIIGESGEQVYGNCPLCGDQKHFYVGTKTGLWDCKKCGRHGNVTTFLTMRFRLCLEQTTAKDYIHLRREKRLPVRAFKRYKVAWDGEQWLFPCFNEKKNIIDLRRWKPGTKKMMSTTCCKTALFSVHHLLRTNGTTNPGIVWLCEGEWDAMALAELLVQARGKTNDVVLGVPGAETFKDEWVKHFTGREIRICYDNDDAGDRGAIKAGTKLRGTARRVQYLSWPESRETGYDVRDHILAVWKDGSKPKRALLRLQDLLTDTQRRAQPSDRDEDGDADEGWKDYTNPKRPMPPIQTLPRDQRPTFKEVVRTFEANGVVMDPEMVVCLRIVLATIAASQLDGVPLWFKIIGAPGGGKTLVIAAARMSDQVIYRSSIGPKNLVSGFGNAASDPSLIPILHGRTLCFKDETQLLAAHPQDRGETNAVLRGAFDGHVSQAFGNGIYREYYSKFNIVGGVTHAVNLVNDAALGERFLRLELRKPNRAEDTARIKRVIQNVTAEIGNEQKAEERIQESVRCFLAFHFKTKPKINSEQVDKLIPLCNLIGYLRAVVEWRRSKGSASFDAEVAFRPQPELGTRLAGQLAKLAISLAKIDGRKQVNESDMVIVKRVARDTMTAFHWEVVSAIYKGKQLSPAAVAKRADIPDTTVRRRIEDLLLLQIIESVPVKKSVRKMSRGKWAEKEYCIQKDIRMLIKKSGVVEQ